LGPGPFSRKYAGGKAYGHQNGEIRGGGGGSKWTIKNPKTRLKRKTDAVRAGEWVFQSRPSKGGNVGKRAPIGGGDGVYTKSLQCGWSPVSPFVRNKKGCGGRSGN